VVSQNRGVDAKSYRQLAQRCWVRPDLPRLDVQDSFGGDLSSLGQLTLRQHTFETQLTEPHEYQRSRIVHRSCGDHTPILLQTCCIYTLIVL